MDQPNTPEPTRGADGKFLQGHSGNPNGRPKKGYSISEMFKMMLAENEYKKQAIINTVYKLATEKEDINAIKLIWNYMDGMPNQKVGLDHETMDTLLDKIEHGKNYENMAREARQQMVEDEQPVQG
jgi:Family of unknown function (DUF5681)